MHTYKTSWLAMAGLALAAMFAGGAPARAADVDYIQLFRTKAIKCIHPTVNADKATVEISKPAETAGDTTTVRIKTFYAGMIKNNAMETEMMIRQAGSIRQMMIKQLSDTGTAMGSCAMAKNWVDF